MYFDVSAVNSGFRRVTITDLYGLESTGFRFQIARKGSPNAMKRVSYTGPKLPLVLEDGEQASFTVDLVPLALFARSDTIVRSEPGQHLTGVLVTSNLAPDARIKLPYQRTYRLNPKSGKSVLTDLCPTPRKSRAPSK